MAPPRRSTGWPERAPLGVGAPIDEDPPFALRRVPALGAAVPHPPVVRGERALALAPSTGARFLDGHPENSRNNTAAAKRGNRDGFLGCPLTACTRSSTKSASSSNSVLPRSLQPRRAQVGDDQPAGGQLGIQLVEILAVERPKHIVELAVAEIGGFQQPRFGNRHLFLPFCGGNRAAEQVPQYP